MIRDFEISKAIKMKRSYLSLENYLRKPRIAFKTTKDVI
jgi:hypothetical protein